jgi:hypothetical protein
VIARLLIQTNNGLDDITEHDLNDLTSACRRREQRTGPRQLASSRLDTAGRPTGPAPQPDIRLIVQDLVDQELRHIAAVAGPLF